MESRSGVYKDASTIELLHGLCMVHNMRLKHASVIFGVYLTNKSTRTNKGVAVWPVVS